MMSPPDDAPADERREPVDEPAPRPDGAGPAGARGLRFAIAIVATLAIMVLLVERFGSGLGDVLRGVRPGWVMVALAMSTAAVLLGALRWQIVLESMRYRLGFARSLEAVLATWPLAVVTPSRANDLLRAVAVRQTVPLAAGTGSVLAEKVVDLSLLLLLAAIGAALESLWAWAGLLAAMLVVLVAGVALLLSRREAVTRWPGLRSRAQAILDLFLAFDALFAAPGRLAAAGAVSLVIRGLTLGITYALLRGVDADVGFLDVLGLWPVAMLAGLAPVTLGGMGTRDATFIYLLEARGHHVTPSSVLAATVGYSAVAVWFFAALGLPFMLRASRRLA
jgi:uncharacterized protein (TIRG00374 family)